MNKQSLKDIINLGEGYTGEFKRSGTTGLGREICAFANASGGVILIGVSDSGDIIGVKDHNRLKSEIQSIARSADPPISIEISGIENVLYIEIPEQHSKPYSFGGKFYIREGATSQQMSREEIREFFFKEGLIKYDQALCNEYNFKNDLTPEIWKNFAVNAHIPLEINIKSALSNLHLIKNKKMTNAGAWLLCHDITRYNLRAGVTCALFRGTNNVHILDRRDFTGNLYSIYKDCMEYMESKLNTEMIPNAKGREERLELPVDALREALVNALVHRDYRSAANVQIHIFHDRLEIITPGGLPAGMKPEDLGIKSVPRNPLLFDMFFRMNLVEQIGSGINRIKELCERAGMNNPLFDISDNWFSVVFNRPIEEVTPQVTPQVEKLLIVLNKEMGRSEIMKIMGFKDKKNFVKNILHPAMNAGLIEMTIPDKPNSRNQKYRITNKGKTLTSQVMD